MIIVPDDFPSVFDGTPAHERCKKIGETRVFTARGTTRDRSRLPSPASETSRHRASRSR